MYKLVEVDGTPLGFHSVEAQQNKFTIFVSSWGHMMSNDVIWPASPWINHLGFYFFLIKSRNNRNGYNIKPECLWKVPIGEFLEINGENWKNTESCKKKMIFGQTYMKLAVAMEMPKMMEMHLTHQNFCDRWMNSYWKQNIEITLISWFYIFW